LSAVCRLALVSGLAGASVLVGAGTPASAAPAPNFSICPAIGVATGCGVVLVINPDGSRTFVSTTAADGGVYDGSDDTLIGVQNNSASPVGSVTIASDITPAIWDFEWDGPCTVTPPPPNDNCGTDPSGYGGPGVTFSNVSTDFTSGTANFSPPIPPGGSLWFSLEGTPTASTLTTSASVGIFADAVQAAPGAGDGYTVTVSNPGSAPITVASIVDTLPAGFIYTPAMTTGGITADPAIAGSQLTWTGPFTVPAAGSLQFHFKVTVASTSGSFTDTVTANAAAGALNPDTATAVITVGTVVPVPAIPLKGIPVAVVTAAAALGAASWRQRRRRTA
jgi:uncharacterized repeat protein (TIGR01451 family)